MVIRPKRRKSKDNLYTINFDEYKTLYSVSFKDCTKKIVTIIINKNIYDAFNKFELDDLSLLNEFDRHIEHSELYDEALYKRALNKPISIEDNIIQKSKFEELHAAIKHLPEKQRKRIKMYYFEDLTMEEIANIEKCSKTAVKYSLDYAIDNLKKILKK